MEKLHSFCLMRYKENRQKNNKKIGISRIKAKGLVD
jgi:hypothetical protein